MKNTLLILCTICSLSACSTNSSVDDNIGNTHFYTLNSLPPSTHSENSLHIGVGPLDIPQLINRPQIVSRKNQAEILMSENHQWGGSHREELLQTITDNLSSLLKTENIEQYPWKFLFKPHYQIRIHLERLDGELGKKVMLKARWRLIKNHKEILVKRAVINTNIKGATYSDYVSAQSSALKVLSKQIATQIRSLE